LVEPTKKELATATDGHIQLCSACGAVGQRL